MKITLVPIRMDLRLDASLKGESLILNGETVDLSRVTEAAPMDAADFGCDWITGEVRRVEGEIELSLILPHGADAPDETRFPKPVRRVKDGVIALPDYDTGAE